ncbi:MULTISPECIES: hypothetical protein [Cupriavidus]|uniref:hypothetical protein n=1 Tax=Cupriavidus sp. DF5525 TaxID=3160989 RepID=UPI0035A8A700
METTMKGSGRQPQGPAKTAGKAKPMTQPDASRIQSATAKAMGGGVPKGSFATRAQRAASTRGR